MNTLYTQKAQKTYTTPKSETKYMVKQQLNLSHGKMLNP